MSLLSPSLPIETDFEIFNLDWKIIPRKFSIKHSYCQATDLAVHLILNNDAITILDVCERKKLSLTPVIFITKFSLLSIAIRMSFVFPNNSIQTILF